MFHDGRIGAVVGRPSRSCNQRTGQSTDDQPQVKVAGLGVQRASSEVCRQSGSMAWILYNVVFISEGGPCQIVYISITLFTMCGRRGSAPIYAKVN